MEKGCASVYSWCSGGIQILSAVTRSARVHTLECGGQTQHTHAKNGSRRSVIWWAGGREGAKRYLMDRGEGNKKQERSFGVVRLNRRLIGSDSSNVSLISQGWYTAPAQTLLWALRQRWDTTAEVVSVSVCANHSVHLLHLCNFS